MQPQKSKVAPSPGNCAGWHLEMAFQHHSTTPVATQQHPTPLFAHCSHMQSMRSWESITYIYNMDLKKKHVAMLWMATLTGIYWKIVGSKFGILSAALPKSDRHTNSTECRTSAGGGPGGGLQFPFDVWQNGTTLRKFGLLKFIY